MSRTDQLEDLLVLARQCRLEESDERRLRLALQSSRELEALYQAGLEFDAQSSLLPGDETRSQDLVERTLARLDERAGARGGRIAPARYFAVSLAAGLLLSVALASAWELVRRSAPAPAEPKPVATASAGVARPTAHVGSVSTSAVELGGAAPVPSASGRVAASHALPVAPAHPARNPLVETTSPSQLFARANELRRQGDVDAAIDAYRRLGELYPSSLEAEDAKVLLGNLLLGRRAPRAALQSFEEYGAGALSLEALWGRAQALRKLESPDERSALERLLRDYPNSPYAKAAQKRLQELPR